jgi:hypothetical protein
LYFIYFPTHQKMVVHISLHAILDKIKQISSFQKNHLLKLETSKLFAVALLMIPEMFLQFHWTTNIIKFSIFLS